MPPPADAPLPPSTSDPAAVAIVLGIMCAAVLFVVLLFTRQYVPAALLFLLGMPVASAFAASLETRPRVP